MTLEELQAKLAYYTEQLAQLHATNIDNEVDHRLAEKRAEVRAEVEKELEDDIKTCNNYLELLSILVKETEAKQVDCITSTVDESPVEGGLQQ